MSPSHKPKLCRALTAAFLSKWSRPSSPNFGDKRKKSPLRQMSSSNTVTKWMVTAKNWLDKIAFQNFALALWGSANKWLDSQVTLGDITSDQERWTIIRPFFKAKFAMESDDKLILDRLAHLAMKQMENVLDYFGRLNKTNHIINGRAFHIHKSPDGTCSRSKQQGGFRRNVHLRLSLRQQLGSVFLIESLPSWFTRSPSAATKSTPP
jgi:hypothetical protein